MYFEHIEQIDVLRSFAEVIGALGMELEIEVESSIDS